jgi:hypothetical protein
VIATLSVLNEAGADARVLDLIAFLESLTDNQFLKDHRFANPWKK